MPIFRLIIAALIIGACFYVYRRFKNAQLGKQKQNQRPAQVVKCATCDLHIPKEEAIEQEGQYYCCKQHTP